MKALDLIALSRDRTSLEAETRRVYGICDGCRRCFNLCPSFNTLLDRIDARESNLSGPLDDFNQVVHECYYCKLCYNHCPYTPPHQYEIDFPHLMIAWKKRLGAELGFPWRDRLLVRTDLMGKIGSRLAPLVNRVLRTPWIRTLMEWIGGIHRDRHVLPFASETFSRWWGARQPSGRARGEHRIPAAGTRKAALFAGCMVTYQATDIGKATVQVLERNGVQVVVPDQQCCGMPLLDLGDTDAIAKAARANLRSFDPWLKAGYDVVSPIPSCSLMFKREYPALVPGEATALLAERTFDVCEYLMRMQKTGELVTKFQQASPSVAYQIPCHLRDQNMGFKSRELMELAGAKVTVVERCSGHDGTWAAKREFFPISIGIARKAVRELDEASAEIVVSDCPLAALQLEQAGASGSSGRRALHPIQIVRDAYGLA